MSDFSTNPSENHPNHRAGGKTFGTSGVTDVIDVAERDRRLATLSHILYALYALSWFTGGVSGFLALIIDYVKRGDARGTVYATHATWRIRTFWWWLGLFVVALPFIFVWIGYVFLFAIWIWGLYRVVKGWLYLVDRKAMY